MSAPARHLTPANQKPPRLPAAASPPLTARHMAPRCPTSPPGPESPQPAPAAHPTPPPEPTGRPDPCRPVLPCTAARCLDASRPTTPLAEVRQPRRPLSAALLLRVAWPRRRERRRLRPDRIRLRRIYQGPPRLASKLAGALCLPSPSPPWIGDQIPARRRDPSPRGPPRPHRPRCEAQPASSPPWPPRPSVPSPPSVQIRTAPAQPASPRPPSSSAGPGPRVSRPQRPLLYFLPRCWASSDSARCMFFSASGRFVYYPETAVLQFSPPSSCI